MGYLRKGMLAVLFATLIATITPQLPAAQSASGCVGAHCIYLPMTSAAGPVSIPYAVVTAFRAVCATYAYAVIENTGDQPISEAEIGMELIYATSGVVSTTLRFSGALLPGQRAEITGYAPCGGTGNDRPTAGRSWVMNTVFDPDTSYAVVNVLDIQYDCSNRYTPVITLTLRNDNTMPVSGVQIFLNTDAGNDTLFTVDGTPELLMAGATQSFTYINGSGYSSLSCKPNPADPYGSLIPPYATAYAFGLRVP
jgi:hypothetical protein